MAKQTQPKISRAIPPDDAAYRLYLRDALEQHRVKPVQVQDWLKDFDGIITELLRENGKTAWAGMFWIRLAGVLGEIIPFYEEIREGMRQVEECPLFDAVCKALAGVRDKFSEEDIVVIVYERDCQAHVFQNAYYLDFKNDGTLKDKRRFSILGKELPKKQVREIIRRRIEDAKHDERMIALEFARRIDSNILHVLKTIQQLPEMITLRYPATKIGSSSTSAKKSRRQ